MRVKGKPNKKGIKGVMYKVPCECGAVYIGKTGCNLQTRLQENKSDVFNRNTKNSIATYVMENDHKIQWEEAQVIASESHLTKRKVKESLLIGRTPNSMNHDKDL